MSFLLDKSIWEASIMYLENTYCCKVLDKIVSHPDPPILHET